MFSNYPGLTLLTAWKLWTRAALLAVAAAACSPSDEPFELPPAEDTEGRPEPANPESPNRATGISGTPDAGATPATVDGGSGGNTPSATPPVNGYDAASSPVSSSDTPPNAGAASPVALDASSPDLGLPALTDDAGVSLACAAEFATCVLIDVLGADACLDDYADCEPDLRGDGGLDGECAVHFSACVLGDPIGFASCFPELLDCQD